jgi:hypothetical protein
LLSFIFKDNGSLKRSIITGIMFFYSYVSFKGKLEYLLHEKKLD